MKNKFLLILFLVKSFSSLAQLLIPFKYGNKWGYINENKEIVIKPQFDEADFFNGAIARVRNDYRFGVIDKQGKLIHECKYHRSSYLHDGYLKLVLSQKRNEKSYDDEFLVNPLGKIINPNKPYKNISISENVILAKDCDLEKYLFYDLNFQPILKDSFNFATNFKNGQAIVKVGNKYTVIDKNGNQLIVPQDEQILSSIGDFYFYFKNSGYHILDKNGTTITTTDLIYPGDKKEIYIVKQQLGKSFATNLSGVKVLETDKKISYFNDSYFLYTDPVTLKNGLIDLKGKVILNAEFNTISNVNDNKVIAEISPNKFGVKNLDGSVIIPFENSSITIQNGFYLVYKTPNSKRSIYNESGKELIANAVKMPSYGMIGSTIREPKSGYLFVEIDNKLELIDSTGVFYKENVLSASNSKPQGTKIKRQINAEGKWGLINEYGEVVYPFEFESFDVIADGVMPAKKNGKWGYLSEKGVLILPCEYDEVIYFVHGFGRVRKGNLWGMVDKNGKFVLEAKYAEVGYMTDGNLYGETNGNRSIFNKSGVKTDEYSTNMSSGSTNKNSSGTPQVYCVSFIMTKQQYVYLYMVQVTDNTGSASESKIIQAARNIKNQKVWSGFMESNILVDTKDCLKAKEYADKSYFKYNSFQVDYTTIK